MNELVEAITTGVTAFSATNIDDLVILMLFFSQVDKTFHRWHIFIGQYLGFTGIVATSLTGFFGGLILPQAWIGLLGLMPIAIGMNLLLKRDKEDSEVEAEIKTSNPSFITSFLSPQICSVAVVTFANGGDNIGIYVPLFASSNGWSLLVIISVFFLLVGLLCYAAYQFTRQRALADALTYYGNALVPFVLIGLGAFIMWDSGTLESFPLTILTLSVSCLCLIGLFISNGRGSQVLEN
ncbi:MAG: cadmium resistance transporter [Gloeocapsa sp. UFS-A4-WI-NPMV-4B04]|jgi:cadmium resistance transport/sequestration family protein|nr:cadmium resistance transporter [Gloeocapsa sp. UFS-A4-WI-NPMV-4B04]